MPIDEPEDDDPTEPDEEQPEASEEEAATGQQPPYQNEEAAEESAAVRASMEYVSGNVNVAAGDVRQTTNTNTFVINSQVDLVRLVRELERDRRPPRPPLPANAPLIDHVRRWFEELPDDRQRCFALTLAIFNGVKFSDYLDLREKIVIGVGVQADKDEPPPSPFAPPTDGTFVAKVEQVEQPDDNGRSDRIIRFNDEAFVSALYELLRHPDGYPDVAIRLLPVLRDIASEYRYWEIRVRAAEAVAEIGQFAFQRIRRDVLEPWAGDARDYVRATVGYPLRRLAEGNACRDQALDLLREWSRPGRHGPAPAWRYRWAAASAYKQIGIIDAPWASPAAISGLRELAGVGEITTVNAVIHSLLVHSLSGQTQMNNVLLALKQWLEEGSRGDRHDRAPQNRCLTAILALMVIADVHLALAADARADRAGDMPITNLFDLVRDGEIDRGDFWQLMVAAGVRSFEFQKIPGFYWLIERWSEYIEADSTLSGTIVRLIVDVYGALHPERYQPRLFRRLDRWERETRNPDLSACATRAKEKILRGDWATAAGGRIVFGS